MTKYVVAHWLGGSRFDSSGELGGTATMEGADGEPGYRPTALLLASLAGCTAMDVISILRKKRQPVTRYEVRASGVQQDDPPHAFTRIDVIHVVEGPRIDDEAARQAIELSATKYCSVGGTLATGITEIHHAYLVRDVDGERTAEVIVTGPREPILEPVPVA